MSGYYSQAYARYIDEDSSYPHPDMARFSDQNTLDTYPASRPDLNPLIREDPAPILRRRRHVVPNEEDESVAQEPLSPSTPLPTISRPSRHVHRQTHRPTGESIVDEEEKNTSAEKEDELFILETKAKTGDARKLKARYDEKKKKESKRRRAGNVIRGPIPAVDFANPTQQKIALALEKKIREQGDKPEQSRMRRAQWEVHTAPNMARHMTTATVRHRAGRGPLDPENIEIVRLYELHLDFKKVCGIINKQRLAQGKSPDLVPNNINCRYNRTGPIICMNANRPFIRVADRKSSKGQRAGHRHTVDEQLLAGWTPEMDVSLVEFERLYDANKWYHIAGQMQQKHPDPEGVSNFPDASGCGYRFLNLPTDGSDHLGRGGNDDGDDEDSDSGDEDVDEV